MLVWARDRRGEAEGDDGLGIVAGCGEGGAGVVVGGGEEVGARVARADLIGVVGGKFAVDADPRPGGVTIDAFAGGGGELVEAVDVEEAAVAEAVDLAVRVLEEFLRPDHLSAAEPGFEDAFLGVRIQDQHGVADGKHGEDPLTAGEGASEAHVSDDEIAGLDEVAEVLKRIWAAGGVGSEVELGESFKGGAGRRHAFGRAALRGRAAGEENARGQHGRRSERKTA